MKRMKWHLKLQTHAKILQDLKFFISRGGGGNEDCSYVKESILWITKATKTHLQQCLTSCTN